MAADLTAARAFAETPCLVVEETLPAAEDDRSAITSGDVLTGWTTNAVDAPEPSSLSSPFRLVQAEIEQRSRGALVVIGRRGQAAHRWNVPRAGGPLRVRSCAAAADDENASWARLQAATADSDARAWAEADQAFQEALDRLGAEASSAFRAQVLRAWGASFDRRYDGKQAEQRYEAALEEDRRNGEGLAVALDLHYLGRVARDRSAFDVAEQRLAAAMEMRQRLAPGSLDEVAALREWGCTKLMLGDTGLAQETLRKALAIATAVAPSSLAVANTEYLLGWSMWEQGVQEAADHHRRANEIYERLAPRSVEMSDNLNAIGVVWGIQGNIAKAREYLQRALVLRDEIRPGDPRTATLIANLGRCAEAQGDLAAAEEYERRAIAMAERMSPESLRIALLRMNLGYLVLARGDLDQAEQELRRSAGIYARLAPRSSDYATTISALGRVALERGDLATADEFFARALQLDTEAGRENHRIIELLLNIAEIKRQRGELAEAEASAQRALAILKEQTPTGMDAAGTFQTLGTIAMDQGQYSKALELYSQVKEIQEHLAPDGLGAAEARHLVGRAYAKMGQAGPALDSLCSALDALETQGTRMGGTEATRTSFQAKYSGYYHECLRALVQADRPQDAVRVLERSRARALLALLAEREVSFATDLTPELARERQQLASEYDRLQGALTRLNPGKDEAEIQKLLDQQRALRLKQEDMAERIRKASPRFASIQYPQPLDLAAMRATLDPGSLLLSYSVGPQETIVFAVAAAGGTSSGLTVQSLPIDGKALREKVEAFRRAIQRPVPTQKAALMSEAADLYDLLVRPVESQVAAADRVLLSLDGPLHSLPFGALVRRSRVGAATRTSFLIEWKALDIVPSATVYAELKKSRRESATADGRLVAFGDPRYPALSNAQLASASNPDIREVTRNFVLTPLPFTRREVDGIARVFPNRADKYLGAQATEEHAKALDAKARYIHFACHGYLDQRFPLNSALVLSIPEKTAEGQDNGLLQAWEIFDQVRIDADMVTLSACDTALGKEMGGEGLLGLTRAFLYAGARSVLGTLWGVSDTSTPLLMERFYAHLKVLPRRDEALRAAQIDFIRGRVRGTTAADLSHPFRWAAYQLSGDWR
jgi:CHAT domain-containing protein/Tfp pilus assembly protein PilF